MLAPTCKEDFKRDSRQGEPKSENTWILKRLASSEKTRFQEGLQARRTQVREHLDFENACFNLLVRRFEEGRLQDYNHLKHPLITIKEDILRNSIQVRDEN